MCFDAAAQPPAAPRRGAQKGSSERLVLTAADGAQPAATLATTDATDAPGVVILPDVRGLHPYYEQLAEVFAGAGVHAVAIDFYSRTAGSEHRKADFDYVSHRNQVTDAQLALDATAGADSLRGNGVDRCYALGFCFGGRGALLQASAAGWSGAVGFYGWPMRVGPEGRSPIGDAREGRVRAPVLAIFGGADDKIPSQDRAAYEAALTEGGATHELVTYPGAPHSFFDRHMAEHAEACADVWDRVLAFVR